MKNSIVALFLFLCGVGTVCSQPLYRYRVYLVDKAGTDTSFEHPETYLSQKSIQRRARQGLCIDSTDLSISPLYKAQVEAAGVTVVMQSKWNNTLLVETNDTFRMKSVAALPAVKQVRKVWTKPSTTSVTSTNRKDAITDKYATMKHPYGASCSQVEMLRADSLHAMGFKGQGMTVAILDGGFCNADAVKLLQNVQLLGTRNFVDATEVYAASDHGLRVLSCMAANTPHVMVGTAPEASYWLLQTEDIRSESMVEEDYWAAALEFADSVGVDVVNTSLGYYKFDDNSSSYTYAQLDGKTALISKTASMAADKGMVVVCSAGNEGNNHWKKVSVPADAEHILAVGAVNSQRMNALFSSVGNTADGRVKPDVMAMGEHAATISPLGEISSANGTSFASPILCGAVVCLWQACPQLTAYQVIGLVRRCADRYQQPDNIFGYGIPNFLKAYKLAQQVMQE